jgi:hypothetical protein
MHHHLLTYICHVENQKAGSCLGDYTDPSWIILVRVAALLALFGVGYVGASWFLQQIKQKGREREN